MKSNMERCKENEVAFCTARCPFNLDVYDFISKIKRNNYNAAYRLYQNAVAFPAIVSALCPEYCKDACPRKSIDKAIELRKIEEAVVETCKKKAPTEYNLPARNQRIAIVGGGACGLSCALKLCNKSYQVSIFEKSDKVGGQICSRLDGQIYQNDFDIQFRHIMPEIYYNTEILGINDDRIKGYDAILISTGKGSCFAFQGKGVFKAGAIEGDDVVESIASGIKVSLAIEKYLLTGIMPEEHGRYQTNLPARDSHSIAPCMPLESEKYNKDDVIFEAKRCLLCSCDFCRKNCDLIDFFNKSPIKMMDEVRATTQLQSVVSDITVATKIIASCNQCGVCREACPEGIDFQAMFLEARRTLHKKGKLPWVFNDFFLRDMEHAHKFSFFFSSYTGQSTSKYLFFPGCQLGASNPYYVLKSYEWLLERDSSTAILADCCGAPAVWAGRDESEVDSIQYFQEIWDGLGMPTVIFACESCMKIMSERYPGMRCKMLYTCIADSMNEIDGGGLGLKFSIFDPCSARNDNSVQDAVRAIVRKSGIEIHPIESERDRAKCCGFGGNPAIVNPAYVRNVAENRIAENDLPYIVYCSNCKDVFRHYGKKAVHVLDIFFGLEGTDVSETTLSQRRDNRRLLHTMLNQKYLGVEKAQSQGESQNEKTILIPNTLKKKLSDRFILEEDIVKVITFCQRSGEKMDSADDTFVGHLKIGYMTYWVEYRIEEDKIILVNAYSHRISIRGDKVDDGQ